MTETKTKLTDKRIAELLRSEAKLNALEAGGVDNWEWFDESLKPWRKENAFDELLESTIEDLHHNCGFIVTQQRILSKKTGTPTLSMPLTFNGVEAAMRGIKRYYNVDVSVEDVSELFVEATRVYFVETNAAARKNLSGKGNLFKKKV